MRNRPNIEEIVIEGNSSINTETIRDQMYSRERTFWTILKGDRRTKIQRDTRGRDTLEIKYLYLTNGFLKAEVEHQIEFMLPDTTSARVRIIVYEGPQYFFGQKLVEGNVGGQFKFELTKMANKLKQGEPLDPLALQHAAFDMKTYLANKGYPYATVDYTMDTAQVMPQSTINFSVYTDTLVHFGNTAVLGDSLFPEYAALRELAYRPGNVYTRDAILESQRRLFETGYYSTLQLTQSETSSDRLNPDFTLRVRERKAHYTTLKAGAGQSLVRDLELDFSLGFGKRNLLGTRKIEATAEYSYGIGTNSRLLTHRYRVRLTNPWIFGLRAPLLFGIEFQPPLRHEVRDFKKRLWALSVENNRRFGEFIRTTVGFEYAWVTYTDVGPSDSDLVKTDDQDQRRKLYGSFRRDSRDDLFIPQRGAVNDFSVEYYGGILGGDFTFVKLQSGYSVYSRMWPGWISASRIRGGLARSYGRETIVMRDEAQYIGGANTIRGFSENTLGPKDSTQTPIGARYIIMFNQEFRWRTIQLLARIPLLQGLFERLPLWQSIFLDVGNGFLSEEEIRFDNLAITYGTGLQLVTPAGPLRLDYARILPTDRFAFDDHWHFTILYAF